MRFEGVGLQGYGFKFKCALVGFFFRLPGMREFDIRGRRSGARARSPSAWVIGSGVPKKVRDAFEGLTVCRVFPYVLMPQAVLLSALLKKLRAPSYFRTQQRAPPRSQFHGQGHTIPTIFRCILLTFTAR